MEIRIGDWGLRFEISIVWAIFPVGGGGDRQLWFRTEYIVNPSFNWD